MPKESNGLEVLLGAGKIYLDQLSAGGARTGELFLGNCSLLETTASGDEITMRDSTQRGRPVLANDFVGNDLDLKITGHQFNPATLALLFGGNVGALAQSSGGPVTNEVISSVKQGYYHQVGGASPKRKLTSVTVTGPSGSPTYVLNTDYELDAERGRVYIVEGGAITTGSNIEVDYSYSAASNVTISGGNRASTLAFLRFVPDNDRGDNYELYIWRVKLVSRESIGFISDQYGSWTLQGKIEADKINHPNDPFLQFIKPA